MLSGRGLCDELITRPEEPYRLCCVVVCDLETSRMDAPYIYDISRLRVNYIVAPDTKGLLYIKPASLGMLHDSCGNQDSDRRNALYLLRKATLIYKTGPFHWHMFRRVRRIVQATIIFVISVCLSVCLSVYIEQLCSHWTDFHKI